KFQAVAPVNGRILTADDVVYSLNRQRDLKVNAGPLANVARAEAVDPAMLKLTLARADADLLVNLAAQENKVVAKEAVDLKGDLKEGPVVGSGAWLYVDGDPATRTTVRRNLDYFVRGTPYVDG